MRDTLRPYRHRMTPAATALAASGGLTTLVARAVPSFAGPRVAPLCPYGMGDGGYPRNRPIH
jgi:hypothetical protein